MREELLHVVRPGIGRFMKNGTLYENEDFMHRTTKKLISDFHRLSKPEIDALIEESSAWRTRVGQLCHETLNVKRS
jgi:hypothetical protein